MLGRATTWIALFTVLVGVATLFGISSPVYADTATFGSDPGWDSQNTQDQGNDVGWKNTSNAGGGAGEIGGTWVRSDPPVFYAQALATPLNAANDSFSASGKGMIENGEGNTMIGFFDSSSSLSWGPSSFIGFRTDTAQLYGFTDGGGGQIGDPGHGNAFTWGFDYDHTNSTLSWTYNGAAAGSRGANVGDLGNLTHFGLMNLSNGGSQSANTYWDDITFTGASVIPEPTSIVLMMLGLGLAPFSRRRR
jgi:hypothetical protein